MERMISLSQLNEILLITGVDVPFPAAQVTIHQPRMKEIALIGEEKFLTGFELLKFSKDLLEQKDRDKLKDFSDFTIFMQILLDQSKAGLNKTECAYLFLQLIFPNYQLDFTADEIKFFNFGETEGQQVGSINGKNFAEFQSILRQLFDFRDTKAAQKKPSGTLAQKIAQKLADRQRKLAARKGGSGTQKVAIYSRYISILTVGEQKDMTSFANYTVFQLLDEFARYQLKMASDIYIKSRLAGASSSDLKEPEDWMKDLYDFSTLQS